MSSKIISNLFKKPINFIIDGIDKSGLGFFLDKDSKKHFIPYTLPGEHVKAIKKHTIKSNIFYSLIEINKKSNQRSEKKCEHFTTCGGCLLQHWSLEEYTNWKLNLIHLLNFNYLNY